MIARFRTEKLLPCPFCGSPALLQRDCDAEGENWISLGCSRVTYDVLDGQTPCVASSPIHHPAHDEAVLVDAWNNRAAMANHVNVEAALDAARSVVWTWGDHGAPTKSQLKRLRDKLSKLIKFPPE